MTRGTPRPDRRNRPGRACLAGLLLALAACGADRGEAAPGHDPLGLLLEYRFTAGRLAGQETWQPCVPADTAALVPRSTCQTGPPPKSRRSGRLSAAEREAQRLLRADTTPATLHAAALFELRGHRANPPALGRAVAALERAHRLAPDDAGILNDLAVAYLELGEREQRLTPMLQALDAAERAVERDSLLAPALFNRALIRERLYLVRSAERAWSRYLAVERRPGWEREARAHARRVAQVADTLSWNSFLKAPPRRIGASVRARVAMRVEASPEHARDFCLRLFGEWGRAVEQRDASRAARLLALAREIDRAAAGLGVDRSASSAVHVIDAAAGDPRRVRALARAHADLAEGVKLFAAGNAADAPRLLEPAEQSLRVAGSSAMARWAMFYRAAAAVNNVSYEAGDPIFVQLLREARPEERALKGKIIWALGLSQLRRGNHDAALRLYREAVPYIASAREPENIGALSLLLAEALTEIGQSAAGRAEAYRALRLLSPFRESNYLRNHLAIVAQYARGDGLSRAALTVTDESVEVARALGRPHVLAQALCNRARDRMALGRPDAARGDLAEALHWAGRIAGGRGGDRIRAHVALARGQLARPGDPAAALPLLAEAVGIYGGFESDLYLPTAFHEAALAARATGDTARARRWLREAVEHIERQNETFTSVANRATFFGAAERVFDEMIDLELEGGRPASAFEYLERSRTATQLGDERRDTAGASAPARLAEIGARLQEDALFVDYALLRDRVVVWTVSRRGWRHHTVPASRDSVVALVDRFAREARHAKTDAAHARARLFDLLVRPLVPELRGVRRLVVVPDRELGRVPFSALWDGETGRFVVEDHQVHTTPSAAFHLEASSDARGARARGSALVVGEPALDSASARSLDPLPGAAAEAEKVAGLYDGAKLLGGADARRGTVLRLLPTHSVFHFAGHAVLNSEQPELSYLALAPDGPGGGGVLRAWEIGELSLSNVEVVVLSACSSWGPRASRTGAITGLAYSFLRAGAPATVSTLWEVDDRATTELLVRFHRRLAAGTPAAEALRLAQVEALKSDDAVLSAPEAWAAFIYTGP